MAARREHINRLIAPTSGTVFIEGQTVSAMNPRQLRELRADGGGAGQRAGPQQSWQHPLWCRK